MLDLTQTRDRHIEERMRQSMIAWFISTRPDGRSHTVPVWFLWDGETILVYTQPTSQKIRNLRQNSQVSLAIDDTHGGEDVVVVEGTAELVESASVNPLVDAYLDKYREGIAEIKMTPESMAATYSQAIRITPQRWPRIL